MLPALEAQDGDGPGVTALLERYDELAKELDGRARKSLEAWPGILERFGKDHFEFQVRGKTLRQPLTVESLSGTKVKRVALPRFRDWGDVLRWRFQENVAGEYPFTAGVFPLKRQGEDPRACSPARAAPSAPTDASTTSPRPARGAPLDRLRLGDALRRGPRHAPDIYGKVGNSGVSIATVDDAKKLYSGFDLCAPTTSVSHDHQRPRADGPRVLHERRRSTSSCESTSSSSGLEADASGLKAEVTTTAGLRAQLPGRAPRGQRRARPDAARAVRATSVLPQTPTRASADGLRACAARCRPTSSRRTRPRTPASSRPSSRSDDGRHPGVVRRREVGNFYSVSISGYHIAEAGANPITQLAFTLANGFTYVEYYLSRGHEDRRLRANLSFFFSNGLDPEYSVIGRVARRIWAKRLRELLRRPSARQKLKYHIQTSGRSLHAQEIAFNDIRTTLQALYALLDNCNSLHTNAYDEAITTPTEESVRRALAIQLIINRELGLAKNENPLQGSFIIEELTDLVEEAVLEEFHAISERGGVLGAMERMYQRPRSRRSPCTTRRSSTPARSPSSG